MFALASPELAIVFRDRAGAMNHLDEFTAFDIWLAGLSDQTFKQIQDANLESYDEKLLEHSFLPHDHPSIRMCQRYIRILNTVSSA